MPVGPRTWAGQTDPGSNLGFAIYMLGHCGQVSSPLQCPISSASLGPHDKLVVSTSFCPVNYEQPLQAQDGLGHGGLCYPWKPSLVSMSQLPHFQIHFLLWKHETGQRGTKWEPLIGHLVAPREKCIGVAPSVCLDADKYKQVGLYTQSCVQIWVCVCECVYVGTHVLVGVYVYSCCGCQFRAKKPTLPVKNQLEHFYRSPTSPRKCHQS